MKKTIILADDHEFLLEGIMTVLKDTTAWEIIATAQSGHQLMSAIARQKPDLVILDLNMPGIDGLTCIKKIKDSYTDIKLLVLTNYNQPELVQQVKTLKADGYLVKNTSSSELKEAIEKVLSGNTYFPVARSLQVLQDDSAFFDDFLKKYQLTKREVLIIRLICQEMTNKEIASSLFLSELTVHTHRRNLFRKLDVKNVAALINFARNNQLIQ